MADVGETDFTQRLFPEEEESYRSPLLVALTALVLGLVLQALFYRQPLGISFPIWAAAMVLAAVGLARYENRRPSARGLWLIAPILFFAVTSAMRMEPATLVLSLGLTLALFLLWVRTFRTGQLMQFGWLDFALALAWVPIEAWLRPWKVLSDSSRRLVGERGSRSTILAVVRGLLLAIPALAIFALLLTAADLVFADYLRAAFRWLNLEQLAEIANRTILAVLAAIFFLGAFVAATRDPAGRRLLGNDRPIIKPFLGFTESAVVIGAVDLLFAVFVFVQFRYLFGGQANIATAGYTYAEYARRGFGELVAVAVLALGMILVLAQFGRREAPVQRGWFNGLSAALVGSVGAILGSALMRLLMYEDAYGFTRLRTYTHVAIIWIAVMCLAFLVLLLLGRLRLFAPACAIGLIGLAATLSVINVDGLIVRENAARMDQTGLVDTGYLSSLSSDGVPSLVGLAARSFEPARSELLGHLACRKIALEQTTASLRWPSYHFSDAAALRALAPLQATLGAFQVDWSGDHWTVKIAGNDEPCFTAALD